MISMRGQRADYDQLAPARARRLERRRGLRDLRELDDHFLGDTEHHRRRRRMAGRAAAPALGRARRRPRGRRRDGRAGDARLQHRRHTPASATPFHVNQKRGPALVGGARLPEAGAEAPQPASGDRVLGRRGRDRAGPRRRRALSGAAAIPSSAGARRGSSCGRRAVASPVILQRSGVGPSEWLAEHGVETAAAQARASAATCRTICSTRHLQGPCVRTLKR